MDNILTAVKSIADRSLDTSRPVENDYIADGLLHCGRCKSPKQAIIHIFDKDMTVGVVCECRQRELEAERTAEMCRRNIMRSGLTAVQQQHTFSTAEVNSANGKQVRYCKNYAARFEELFTLGKGLLLYGRPSAGKSFLAECIANELLNQGRTVRFISAIEIVERYGLMNRDEYESYSSEIRNPELMILDDLGTERDTAFSLERVHDTINYRTGSGRPLIVTTNYTLEEMKNPADIRHSRMFERLFASCFLVPFAGNSFRRQQANSSYADIKRLLEG